MTMSENTSSSTREQRLQRVLADYQHAVAAGNPPDPEELLRRHPDLAGDLAAFFGNRATAEYLPERLPQGPGAGETLGITGPAVGGVVRSFGDYELLSEVGRGGMGVVFEARQLSLARIVALKMILSDAHADAAQLRRFRTEAEAIARLQHPGIVQVYEVGEHEGRPFFALEFCPGGTLERKLAGTPMQPRDAAELVRQLAEAMQVAHTAQVIHRDLKPANVLLASGGCEPPVAQAGTGGSHPPLAGWVPKITDFGLARKLDVQGQTQTGAALGTPSYMAPEQAAGKKEVGPIADVYALGAILYECLTGRPPFRAATPFDTLRQVVNDEPVPPRQLNARVPRDLETICLKCLQKEPPRRYASAKDLGDDLGRFLRGEPIDARPIGAVGRVAKWARRNPVVAALWALVFVALAAGTIASTLFALDASAEAKLAEQRAGQVSIQKGIAEGKAKEALGNAKKAQDSARQTAKALQQAETTLARGILRPLALSSGSPLFTNGFRDLEREQGMTEVEWEALWELAASRPGRLGYRFVEEATATPQTSRQLRDRAALALDAAVGLDLKRRDEVEALLLSRLDAPALPEGQKTDLARAAAEWGSLDVPAANRTARQLTAAMKKTRDEVTLRSLARSVAVVAARMEPRQAALTLTQAMKDTTDKATLSSLVEGIAAGAARLEPKDAARAAALLKQAMKDVKTVGHWWAVKREFARALAAVAARMEPRQAVITLAQAVKDTWESEPHEELAKALLAVTARMDSRDKTQVAVTLAQAIKDSKDSWPLDRLARAAAAVAGQLESEDAAKIVAALAAQARANGRWSEEPAWALAAVATRMGPKDASQAAVALRQATKENAKKSWVLPFLARALAEVTARLGPRDAALAVSTLTQALRDANHEFVLDDLGRALAALAAQLEPRDAAEAAAALAQVIKDRRGFTSGWGWLRLGPALAALAARMGPREAAQAAAALAQTIKDTKDEGALSSLKWGLAAVMARMEPRQATAALTQALKDAKDRHDRSHVAQAVAALAARLEPREAAQTAAALAQAMKDTEDEDALRELLKALAALAAHLEPESAAQVAAALAAQARADGRWSAVQAWALAAVATRMGPRDAPVTAVALRQATRDNAKVSWVLPYLARALAEVTARLGPRDAALAVSALTQALRDANHESVLDDLGRALAALAAQLEPRDAAEAAAALAQVIKDRQGFTSWWTRQRLGPALAALAERMGPKEAVQAAAALAQAIKDTKDEKALSSLKWGLAAVAARMEPGNAAQAAASLVQAMKQEKDAYALCKLAEVVAELAARLEPREAARVASQAAAVLAQAMKQDKEGRYLADLGRAVATVAARLEPTEAARVASQAAAVLAQAMKQDKNGRHLADLGRAVATVATRLEPTEAHEVAAQAAAVLAQSMKKPKTDYWVSQALARALAAVAARMEPRQANQVAAQAATALLEAMKDTSSVSNWSILATALAAVTARMEPGHAGQATVQATAALAQAMNDDRHSRDLASVVSSLPALAARMGPEQAAQAAAFLIETTTGLPKGLQEERAQVLNVLLVEVSPAARRQRAGVAAAVVGCAEHPLLRLPFLLARAEPLPSRLSTQQLVELLKLPTCFGAARRHILDHLGNRYQRRFADHWEFVRFATERNLGLDFLSPPQRPGMARP
jgi:hypothetical protein